MKRSSKPELIKRINRAFVLLEKKVTHPELIQVLKKEFGISEIQAYRYIQQAKKNMELLPVPESTKIFTTKLAYSLIDRIKGYSKSVGIPINHLVGQALEDYLKDKGNGQKKE